MAAHPLLRGLPVLRVQQRRPACVLVREGVGLVAQHREPARVEVGGAGGRLVLPDPAARGVQRRTQPLLVLQYHPLQAALDPGVGPGQEQREGQQANDHGGHPDHGPVALEKGYGAVDHHAAFGKRPQRDVEARELRVVEHEAVGAAQQDGDVPCAFSPEDAQAQAGGGLALVDAAGDHAADDPVAQERLPAGIHGRAERRGHLPGAGGQGERTALVVGEERHGHDHRPFRQALGVGEDLGEPGVLPELDAELAAELLPDEALQLAVGGLLGHDAPVDEHDQALGIRVQLPGQRQGALEVLLPHHAGDVGLPLEHFR